MSASSPQPAETPRGICVIGMGRSGTSVLANLISELGIALGPTEQLLGPAPRGENPRGYWEQREIVNLNDALLAHLGGGWYDIVDLPAEWELDPELDELYSRARALISELFGDEGRWAFKDPRASLTLPFWRRAAGPAGQRHLHPRSRRGRKLAGEARRPCPSALALVRGLAGLHLVRARAHSRPPTRDRSLRRCDARPRFSARAGGPAPRR